MSRFIQDRFSALEEYIPGEQPQDKKYIKLNTNESPYPPSKKVLKSINKRGIADLRLYCDPDCRELKSVIANEYSVSPENVFLSNGSDDILNFSFLAFSQNGVAFADITYGFYSVFAQLHGVDAQIIPLNDDFTLNVESFCALNKLIVIANPNAPTGIAISLEEIERIVKSNKDSVVLIDEAYVDFGGESCVELTKKYDNLLCVQTFSKSRSLAGGRLGFAFGSKELINDLEKIKYSTNPYNINRLTQTVGIATVKDSDYYKNNSQKIRKTRKYVVEELRKMGFGVLDSKANFVFAESQKISGRELYEKLKQKGVLIRYFDKERINNYNRITIGSEKQMKIFISKVKEILGEKNEVN